jgi:glyoxylase-like metal-dependent hydrolase (beta-lactamase superfamily II)
MTTLHHGPIRIDRVEDYLGPGFVPEGMFPGIERWMLDAEREWLLPNFFIPQEDRLRTSVHSWVVRTGRHNVLIDACVGNYKVRHAVPSFHMREAPWLERLAGIGLRPEDIDFVFCTHLHADHIGWNTRLQDGRWVPTFPNARYLFGRTEFARWDARDPAYQPTELNRGAFEDSILPVLEAGLADFVDDGHEIDALLRVEASPGHTPGHACARLRMGGSEALFTGDVIHHPIQIRYPQVCSVFDDDSAKGLATRLRLLNESADRDVRLFPTHFAEPHCCKVVSAAGGGFAIDWR